MREESSKAKTKILKRDVSDEQEEEAALAINRKIISRMEVGLSTAKTR